jgi:lipopolysaccharide export system protein LptC
MARSSMILLRWRHWLSQFTLYLPVVMMALLALGSWWLARNTPNAARETPKQVQRLEPDYYLKQFSVKNFDPQGLLTSEVFGEKARHFPDTGILEIDQARFKAARDARTTTGQSDRAYSNADGSEVQMVGNALVIREAGRDAQGNELPKLEIRSQFLHAFLRTEEIKSNQPVTILRGSDQFSGDSLVFNKTDNTVQLDGRVRVRLESKAASQDR